MKTKTLIALLAVGAYLAVLYQSSSHVELTQTYTVQRGDTVWSIATAHDGGDANTGEVVYEIETQNHLNNGVIHAGEVIKVPAPSDQK